MYAIRSYYVKSGVMENRKFRVYSLLADFIILIVSFLFMASLKPAGLERSAYTVMMTGTTVSPSF